MIDLGEEYWTKRYADKKTGWDARQVTTPIKEYIDQLKDKSIKILIPGCGSGHEVKYLHDSGFYNVFVVDISQTPLMEVKSRCRRYRDDQFIHGNFFNLEGKYDLILEQTFFCALHPSLRGNYIDKMNELLSENGKLVGVLFNIPLHQDEPPFGGHKTDYEGYFIPKMEVLILEECYNSIPPRSGSELFLMARKISN